MERKLEVICSFFEGVPTFVIFNAHSGVDSHVSFGIGGVFSFWSWDIQSERGGFERCAAEKLTNIFSRLKSIIQSSYWSF